MLARLRGEAIACGCLKFTSPEATEIKRMWVSPAVRGLGVARRLLTALEDEARRRGAERVRLDTNHSLTEAINLYRASGYTEIPAFNDERYADHWFEKPL